ncbi:hypothetical protein LX36DRAFT_208295 [Colletotrichum falcatum]|nr:hypothetical protein LX36DRAFT_208295 [Colletotrichum falcatum]
MHIPRVSSSPDDRPSNQMPPWKSEAALTALHTARGTTRPRHTHTHTHHQPWRLNLAAATPRPPSPPRATQTLVIDTSPGEEGSVRGVGIPTVNPVGRFPRDGQSSQHRPVPGYTNSQQRKTWDERLLVHLARLDVQFPNCDLKRGGEGGRVGDVPRSKFPKAGRLCPAEPALSAIAGLKDTGLTAWSDRSGAGRARSSRVLV